MAIGDETIRSFAGPASGDPLLGTVVDGYRIESVVGSGAMGIVYRGVHLVIGKPVAIKVLKSDFADDPEMVQRLVREARTVNSIKHPAIVNAFNFGTVPRTSQPYIVMDLLEGEPMDAWMTREAPMTLRAGAPVFDELLSALAAAHKVGVIHRDLKPGNCFLERQTDGSRHVKLLDFGLAKQADRAGGSIRPTNPNTLIGTPAFMAPEQVVGGKLTPATDLYAFGGMLYQALTGHLPHEAPTAIEVLTQKMKFDPLRPRQWVPDLDPEIDEFVMELLEREPEKRPRDAEAVLRSLRRLAESRTMAVEGVHVNLATPATPAGNRSATGGVVPNKREWAEVRTILLDGTGGPTSAEASTDSHQSPWARPAGVTDSEPTEPPGQSPFRNAVAAPNLTPPTPTLRMETPPRILALKDVDTQPDRQALEDTTIRPNALVTPPDEGSEVGPPPPESAPPSSRGLMVALALTVLALVVGLVLLAKAMR